MHTLGVLLLVLVQSAVQSDPLPAPAVAIGVSRAMPVVGETVTISLLDPATKAKSKVCRVVDPQGAAASLPLDEAGHASWKPARYGKYTLHCGKKSVEAWVLARPMTFHWWDPRNCPRHATVVMNDFRDYWKDRGVKRVQWTVGEYASRKNGEYGAHPYSQPEQWFNDWLAATKKSDGMALDEVYCAPEAPSPAIVQAIALLRKKVGEEYVISVYSSGTVKGFDAEAKLLRESRAICLIESYYGDDDLFQARWNALARYGLQELTLFAIGPGFRLRPDCHGPLTEAEVRETFARVRRVAPQSPGIALYNAYSLTDRATIQPGLDAACSQAIEDYYLKPVVCIVPLPEGKPERFAAWNIGNEDAEGHQIQWLDAAGKPIGGETVLPKLRPWGKMPLAVPAAAKALRLKNPAGTVNLYPDGCFDFSKR